jgi:hypothetical protein
MQTHAVLKINVFTFIAVAATVGVAQDFVNYYIITPYILPNDPIPPPHQFMVWEIIGVALGVIVLYIARARSKKR